MLARQPSAAIDKGQSWSVPADCGAAGLTGSSGRATAQGYLRGAIAQLGERYNGIVEVSGSIPLSSTKPTLQKPALNGGFCFG